jgi:mannose-1-phosphate guanylyltransferase
MKAMVLAAGLGTRLRTLTNDRPKALVEVNGRTLLEITLKRLLHFGVHDVIVNTHHFANMIPAYLKEHDNFGMRIEISHEDLLLDTGGGLKKAAWFFLEDGEDQPFLLHNVDVISTIDLTRMMHFHTRCEAFATMAVQERPTSRPLLFDRDGQLRARGSGSEMAAVQKGLQALAFSGIHVISPRIFSQLPETGAFPIIDAYLRLAASGERIRAFRADEYFWRDLGRPENVAEAAQQLESEPIREP